MIQDLHSHTYYSLCGKDTPEELIEAAIAGGIEVLGISDHNYGVAGERYDTICPRNDKRIKDYKRSLQRYYDHIQAVARHLTIVSWNTWIRQLLLCLTCSPMPND